MMTDEAVYERLRGIFRAIFDDQSIVLRPETSAVDISGWDSFNNASLIVAIEKEFGVRFRTAELQALKNVGDYVELICSKLRQRG